MLLFFFQAEDGIRDGHVTGVQTCALPISQASLPQNKIVEIDNLLRQIEEEQEALKNQNVELQYQEKIEMANIAADRKSTRLNSSHVAISYAVFCLKKKKDRKIYIHTKQNC